MIKLLVTLGTTLLGLSLIGLGIHVLWPAFASNGYGVPLGGDSPAYLLAAGARDASLGVMALGILRWHRNVLPWFLGCLLIVPMGDVLIVWFHGPAKAGLTPHLVGTIGLVVLLGLAVRERRRS